MGVRFINYYAVGFSVCLALGILLGYLNNSFLQLYFSSTTLVSILIVSLVVVTLLWSVLQKKFSPTPLFSIAVGSTILLTGFTSYTLRLPENSTDHYFPSEISAEKSSLQLKVKETLKPDSYNHKYIAELIAINGAEASGKVLVYHQKDSLIDPREVDDIILVSSVWKEIPDPKNPHQFNYKRYMQTLGVYGEVRVNENNLLKVSKGKITIKGFSEKIRNHIIGKLKESKLDTPERGIVQALILGQRNEIDKELYQAYAAAGAIHILAVSGLHVGILYFLLLFLFRPLTYLPKGKMIRSIVIVLLLWCFALLAGLSPSVVRSVTMFSFFTFATAVNRPANGFNTLFLSFFVLLFLKPNWLFHVGFQLSYLAVFFILWVQPKLYQLYRPTFYIDRLLWSIITVTFAAQLGIFPLSLYYFHQFPGLFFITNIVVLPFLGILLAGGLLLVILAVLKMLPDFFAKAYNTLISSLNTFIDWVARQEDFLFQDISFSGVKALVTSLLIISLLFFWKYFSYKKLLVVLGIVCVFILVSIWEKQKQSYNELVVFHKSRKTLITVKESDHLTIFMNDTLSETTVASYPLKGYRTETAIQTLFETKTPTYFRYADKTILVLDSIGVYPKLSKVDVVLLTHSPKINLERLIDSISPSQIIADGSNYKSYVKRWKETCRKRKLPFHHTGSKGAFTLK